MSFKNSTDRNLGLLRVTYRRLLVRVLAGDVSLETSYREAVMVARCVNRLRERVAATRVAAEAWAGPGPHGSGNLKV